MFTSRHARAVGRTAFGVVTIAGAVLLVVRLLWLEDARADETLAAIWLVALFAAWLSTQIAAALEKPEPRTAGRPFVLSWVLPAIGSALLLPLSIHAVVGFALFGHLRNFDDWARASIAVTGIAHLVFAFLVAVRAADLACGRRAISSKQIYMKTLVASAIPFALLFLIPPILVGLTGAAILPLLARMRPLIERDRASELPRAIVVA